MYNKNEIERLTQVVSAYAGQKNKEELGRIIQSEFDLTYKKPVYIGEHFTIRFSKGECNRFNNTVLALSKLEKYDERPFIVCLVGEKDNHLFLANATFLKKVSHSSKELRIDNIRGSFNGSDIFKEYIGIANTPAHFEELFAIHEGFSFEENLKRLVEETNNITPQDKRTFLDEEGIANILNAVQRSKDFIDSEYYRELEGILEDKVQQVHTEINLLAHTDNVNLRGRRIEYLVTTDYQATQPVRDAILNEEPIPTIHTPNGLGDFTYHTPQLTVEVDIKTKLTNKASEPKGYNVDKLLELLSQDDTIFMVFIISVHPDTKEIKTQLVSVLDEAMIAGTTIQHHWAGRNSRGVAQFSGRTLEAKIEEYPHTIHTQSARRFLKELIDL